MLQKHIDPDRERDPGHIFEEALSGPVEALPPHGRHRETGKPLGSPQAAHRALATKKPRTQAQQDSARGLAAYFLSKCPPPSWDTGLEHGNFFAIVGLFSWLKKNGADANTCRAMVDKYFLQLSGRRPNSPYVWDFKYRCPRLLTAVQDAGVFNRPEDYSKDWAPEVTKEQAQSYSDSWKGL
jgi:hypothetical protein